MKFKVGFGFDVHPLIENTDFWLGGIRIPYSKGASGHSDADTLIIQFAMHYLERTI